MLASGCMSRSAGKLGSSPGAMSVGGSEAGGGSQARRKTASGSGLSDLEKPRPIEMADAQIAAESNLDLARIRASRLLPLNHDDLSRIVSIHSTPRNPEAIHNCLLAGGEP